MRADITCPAARHAALQHEGADLIDAGALTDQALTYAMQCLQIELIGGLGGETNFIVGRCTASAIASASRKSFFGPFE